MLVFDFDLVSQLRSIHFQKQKSNYSIHPIDVDEQGNLIGAPDGYREFFIREENSFLGLD